MTAWRNFQMISRTNSSVLTQIDYQHKQNVQENRSYLKSLLRVAIVCAKGNHPLRGHDESGTSLNKGLFLDMIELLKQESSSFNMRYNSLNTVASYCSPSSQNALLESLTKTMKKQLISQLRQANFFAVIADGTRDIRGYEQLAISIRYVYQYGVQERFLGFVTLSGLEAPALSKAILDMLAEYSISTSKLVEQCYDTASVMSGQHAGVQALIKRAVDHECPYVHCYAHKLQLVLSHTLADIPAAKKFLELLNSTVDFLRNSPCRKSQFQKLLADNSINPVILPSICQHKWTYNHKAVATVFSIFPIFVTFLKQLSESGRLDDGILAKGLIKNWSYFENIFLLCTLNSFLALTDPVSRVLQSSEVDIPSAQASVEALLSAFKTRRSDSSQNDPEFLLIFSEAESLHSHFKHESKRRHQIPSHLENFALSCPMPSSSNSDQTSIRIELYNTVLDKFISELERGFISSREILNSISCLCPGSSSFLTSTSLEYLCDAFHISKEGLKAEAEIAYNLLHEKHTSLSSCLTALSIVAVGFPVLMRLFTLALTFPVSNCSCERAFSTLKHSKNYLRNSMTQIRLNNLAMLCIHKDLTEKLDLDQVVDEFSNIAIAKSSLSDATSTRRIFFK